MMLQADALREILAFFHSFELGGLLLANRQLSQLASKCVKVDRVKNVSVQWYLTDQAVISRQNGGSSEIDELSVNSKGALERAVARALNNCFVEELYVDSRYGIFSQLRTRATVKRLDMYLSGGEKAGEIIEFLSSFHSIKVIAIEAGLMLWKDDVKAEVAEYCRAKGVLEFDMFPNSTDRRSRVDRLMERLQR